MTSARQFGGTMFRMPGISSRRCGTSYMSILKLQCAKPQNRELQGRGRSCRGSDPSNPSSVKNSQGFDLP
jgi:hypothetical protein